MNKKNVKIARKMAKIQATFSVNNLKQQKS